MITRVWYFDEKVFRELHGVSRNEFGDILLTLDGGDVLQFTPRNPVIVTPPQDRIAYIGRGRDSKTDELTEIAFLILKNPKEDFKGNIRTFKSEATAAPESPAMLTIREAAAYADKSEKTIRNWIQSKDTDGGPMLPGVLKVGRKYSIPRESLDKWK